MPNRDPEEFRIKNITKIYAIWQLFRQNHISIFSFYLFILLIIISIFAEYIVPYDSHMQFLNYELMPPSWVSEGEVTYFLGTDDLGRDVLSRILMGVKYTFGSATIVVIVTALIGGILGIIIGMNSGIKSRFLRYFFDSFLSVPILLIAIIIATLMETSLVNAMLAITLALLPHFIDEISLAVQRELKKEYVLLQRLDGASHWYLLKEIILPNITVPYIKETARIYTIAILDISALSFISLGAQRPTPEWGAMIRDSIELIYLAPWTVILPGSAIILTILMIVILCNGLCKAINKYYE